ncbi:MAG: hypothetical protein LBU95_03965 [Rikenellaceae bacterium]|jgi:hypothetical protein|nr:hypothetical protein [Rikenellaceae bacterium]
MLKINFFRSAKPRGFNYKPRYFDPEKEAREERKREILGEPAPAAEAGEQEEEPGDFIRRRGFRRNSMGISSRVAEKRKTSTIRAVIALVMLVALLVWWFTSK